MLLKDSKTYIKKLNDLYEIRKKEFEPQTYMFDITHRLAETIAEYCLVLLQERSLHSKKKIGWDLSVPVKTIYVKLVGQAPFTFQYYINGRKCSSEDARIMIAVNELIKAEDYIK